MNSKQRRIYKRYISKNLEEFIEKGLSLGLVGCYEYDLPNTKRKLYIDYPEDGDIDTSYIYVSAPFAHILNVNVNRGRYVALFDATGTSKVLSEISFLRKINLVNDIRINSENHYPKFAIEMDGDVKYYMYANGKKIQFEKVSGDNAVSVSFEDIFTDESVPVHIRKGMAFHMDVFKSEE